MTEELVSLKTETNDIVQGSVNLVTEQNKLQSNLPNNQPYDIQPKKTQNKQIVNQRNQIESCSSADTWNARNRIFGSFRQNDQRFSDESRGFQCTCNALCMLSYTACCEIEK